MCDGVCAFVCMLSVIWKITGLPWLSTCSPFWELIHVALSGAEYEQKAPKVAILRGRHSGEQFLSNTVLQSLDPEDLEVSPPYLALCFSCLCASIL